MGNCAFLCDKQIERSFSLISPSVLAGVNDNLDMDPVCRENTGKIEIILIDKSPRLALKRSLTPLVPPRRESRNIRLPSSRPKKSYFSRVKNKILKSRTVLVNRDLELQAEISDNFRLEKH